MRRWPRRGRQMVLASCVFVLVEASFAPLTVNAVFHDWDPPAPPPPPPRIAAGSEPPPAVYTYLASLPPSTVLLHLPFGSFPYEVRYMYYSTLHWHPMVNGYSGHFPAHYMERRKVLRHPLADPEASWSAVHGSGATHVVLDRTAFSDDDNARISAWLVQSGARRTARFEADEVYALRPVGHR